MAVVGTHFDWSAYFIVRYLALIRVYMRYPARIGAVNRNLGRMIQQFGVASRRYGRGDFGRYRSIIRHFRGLFVHFFHQFVDFASELCFQYQ